MQALLRTLAALLAAAFASAPAGAVPFSVVLGLDRIVLDTPPGMSDALPFASPRLNELAESLTSASNRILIFALTDADSRRFTTGDRPDLKRYLIAVTPRALERERVSTAQFEAFVADALRELGPPAKEADPVKFLDTLPRGRAGLIAELRRDPGVVSVLQGARIVDNSGLLFGDKAQYVVSTTTLMQARGKALSLSVYSPFESPADLEWIRFNTTRWIEELERLNRP